MRQLLFIVCLLISVCSLSAQDNTLEIKKKQYVESFLDQAPSAAFLHYLEHYMDDNGAISVAEQKALHIQYLEGEFYSLHREKYEAINFTSLPGYMTDGCDGGTKPTACDNGGFEDGFLGYYGRGGDGYSNGGDDCDPNSNLGEYDDAANAAPGHLAIVNQGFDPVIGILNRVEFDSLAARINSHIPSDDPDPFNCFNREVDQLAKKFWVTEKTQDFTLHYAVVLQNPTGHDDAQPFFNVKILLGPDYTTEIFDFCFDAENDAQLVTYEEANNPPGCGSGNNMKFKDWSCLKVDLSKYVGCPVLLQVTTADCGAGAHYGYSYVDGICEPCKDGPGEPLVFIDDVGPCEENSVKISGHWEVPDGYDMEVLELKGGGIEITTSNFVVNGNEFCVTLTQQDFIDAGITDCANFTVTGLFNNGTDLITSVSAPVEICLADVTCEGCLQVEIKNIQCINNGTTDPSDDQWIFEIQVTSTSPESCGYWYSKGDVEEAGPLDSCKVIWMGPIANYGSTVSFTVFDGCDETCFEEIEIPVPEPCSPPCELETEVLKVSDCDENGEYTITIDVTGVADDQCWMAIIKKENGTTEVLGNYTGSGTFTLGPIDASDGNVVLWVKLCDFFDCLIDIYVFAPECCLDVEISNVMCLNNGTSDPSDDQWTFDISVNSNSPNSCGYWKAVGDYEGAGSLNNTKVVYMGQISDYGSQITFKVFDGCDEECYQVVTIDVPKPCSPDCDLELKDIKVGECIENQYFVQVTVTGTNGECWMAKQKKQNGDEVLLGTFYGDGTEILGPFDPDDGDFTLWIKMCDQFDCLLDKFVFAPSCGGLQPEIDDRTSFEARSVHIYPNPVQDQLNIEFYGTPYHSFQIQDITGKILMDNNIMNQSQLRIRTSGFQPGIYVLTFFNEEKERQETKRVLIIR